MDMEQQVGIHHGSVCIQCTMAQPSHIFKLVAHNNMEMTIAFKMKIILLVIIKKYYLYVGQSSQEGDQWTWDMCHMQV